MQRLEIQPSITSPSRRKILNWTGKKLFLSIYPQLMHFFTKLFRNAVHFRMLAMLCFFLAPDLPAQDGGALPEPRIVAPGRNSRAPSDAIVLFGRGNLEAFESAGTGTAAGWNVKGRKFTVAPGAGNIQTRERFGDCQLHIEWKTPKKDVRLGKEGQQNGNSGIYLMGKYEIQVLNSYINKTDPDRQAGALYSRRAPLVNASRRPGKWQCYDILFTAPRFHPDGSRQSPGFVTVLHNGVLIQYHAEIAGPTTAFSEQFPTESPALPLMLQDHTNEVSYRNIWIRKL
jgi:hypothetical protein